LTGCILGIVCTESGRRESNPHHQLGRLSHKLPSLIAATEFSTRKKPPARCLVRRFARSGRRTASANPSSPR
jgi:hypothetical protein